MEGTLERVPRLLELNGDCRVWTVPQGQALQAAAGRGTDGREAEKRRTREKRLFQEGGASTVGRRPTGIASCP